MDSGPLAQLSAASIAQLVSTAPSDSRAVQLLEGLIPDLRKSLGASQTQGEICGRVFKRGDIAFNCRTCQSDPNCVQWCVIGNAANGWWGWRSIALNPHLCSETCFRASNHEGHDVLFHRAGAGGSCDCGDIEAWKIDG